MLRRTTTYIVLITFGFISLLSPTNSIAADHIVSERDLQSALQNSEHAKQENIDKIMRILKSEPGNQALKHVGTDWTQVEKILPTLSDEETAKLAVQADQVQTQFAAGYHWDPITVLLIAFLIIAIIVLISKV
ncbi:PA2779 family protein [bacterium]|nr:PA2779 family protein [bacterium]